MALFLNAHGRAEFPVQILCLLMNRRAFQTFDVGCAGEKGLQDLSSGFQLTGHTVKKSQAVIGVWAILNLDRLLEKDLSFLKFLLLHHQARIVGHDHGIFWMVLKAFLVIEGRHVQVVFVARIDVAQHKGMGSRMGSSPLLTLAYPVSHPIDTPFKQFFA